MTKHTTIRRFSLIIEKIEHKTFPSFDDIQDYLQDHDFEISPRTLQRDLEQIRRDFGVEITYNKNINGYYIDSDLSPNLESFLRFMEIAKTSELIMDSLKESRESLDYIDFESKGDLRGIELLRPLLYAIRNQRKIRISYKKFFTDSSSKYQIYPYLLKEYMYRWYLVGIVARTNEFRTFGIDRIVDLKVSSHRYIKDRSANPKEFFTNVIGLTYSTGELTEVELSFTPLQGKYIKTLPLHDSQEIIKDNAKELRVRLYIKPNFEFIQRLLMMGEAMKVLKPDSLKKEVKQKHKAAFEQYG